VTNQPASNLPRVLLAHLALLLVIESILTPTIQGVRFDPATGRIRLLYMGDPWSFQQNRIVLDWIDAEPRLTMVVVPCDLQVMEFPYAVRYTRQYLPRNYRELNSSYDVIVPNNISPRVIERKIVDYFRQAVEEDGMGAYLVGFDFWDGTNEIDMWQALEFYDLLPADIDTETYQYPADGKIHYEILKEEPIFDLPGDIESLVMFVNRGGDIYPRQGSVVHAVWKGRRTAALVTGEYGKGRTLQLDQAWNDFDIESMRGYRYFADLIYNQIYFVADVTPPEDLALAHRTREMFIDVEARRKITLALLEFVDIFGGNVRETEERIAKMDRGIRDAKTDYIRGDITESMGTLRGAIEELEEIDDQLSETRSRALMWIYLSEWIVVASTSMVCGVVIWTLMVKRSAYREVSTSRHPLRRE
jgi:hypothetical protein